MARGISEFKTKLIQGGARPNLFMVRLKFPQRLASVQDIGVVSPNDAKD